MYPRPALGTSLRKGKEGEDTVIKNIIFDMGNVLLQFRPQVALDTFFDTQEDKDIINRELFLGPEWIMGDEGIITNEERYDRICHRIPERLHEQFKRCIGGWDACLIPVPGADEFCQEAKERGYGMYILSNACNRFRHFFPREFREDYFDGIVVSSEIKLIKPNPEIYNYILKTYGLKPEECLFLDDREENVETALGTGMRAEVFKGDWEEIRKGLGWQC